MQPVEIRPSIYWIGVNDRHTEFFEGLWSIRNEGISYNSYLILDEKKAIIDLCNDLSMADLLEKLHSYVNPAELDYLIINHMEPDHTGGLRELVNIAPNIKLIGSARAKEMLDSFYMITENIQVVADGDELDLGTHKLRFFSTPFVHWPETMMTYESTEKIVFSCDGFGGYGTLDGSIFDDRAPDLAKFEQHALRYFVNIVSSYAKPVKNAIAKLSSVPIEIVAPSHGLIWRKSPQRIIDLYQKWADYASTAGDPGVTLLYCSMYGHTEKMMEVIAQGVADEGAPLAIFNVSHAEMGEILPSLWIKRGVIIGAPTYEGGLFPHMSFVLDVAQRKHIFNKISAEFGSYGWGGGSQREYNERIKGLRWESFGEFAYKGTPDASDMLAGRQFGADFARKIREG
jgi:anaerobic nitric oxide reductase flavorubredoxin